VIDAALRLASFDASFQRLQITTAFGRDLPQVLADRDQLQQLFLNVLLNARDAMPDGGELKVATSADESYVRISIDDTGSGITPDDLKHVFDPFFTTKPSGRGTGLGLAVCYGIITAHGGKMEITNLDNTGTQVHIAVPFEA
jgi:two-component system NtrC family sensor kinase